MNFFYLKKINIVFNNQEASTSGASSGISTPRAHRPPAKIGQSSSSGATAGGPIIDCFGGGVQGYGSHIL